MWTAIAILILAGSGVAAYRFCLRPNRTDPLHDVQQAVVDAHCQKLLARQRLPVRQILDATGTRGVDRHKALFLLDRIAWFLAVPVEHLHPDSLLGELLCVHKSELTGVSEAQWRADPISDGPAPDQVCFTESLLDEIELVTEPWDHRDLGLATFPRSREHFSVMINVLPLKEFITRLAPKARDDLVLTWEYQRCAAARTPGSDDGCDAAPPAH